VAIQLDGKILVAGSSADPSPFDSNFALARYRSDGKLDNRFGGNGKLTTDLPLSGNRRRNDRAAAVAVQRRDGRIVVAGRSDRSDPDTGNTGFFALARYHAFACGLDDATIVGQNDISGGVGRDVIVGFSIAGFDRGVTLRGAGGDDILCGGAGNDILFGGDGNDTLFGETGVDKLDGEKGTDTCVGSSASGDAFFNCETINSGSGGFSGAWKNISQRCNAPHKHFKCKLRGTLTVTNPGTETTAVPTLVAFYLSADPIWDENDVFFNTARIGAMGSGETRTVRFHAKLREQTATGQFVIAVLDFFDVVTELNEDNNVVVSPPLQ
jgi:Ca2+-binding RTX toxin-like protein